jgi:ATP-dependent Clp protease ATP-binding subunit ClpC
MTSNIGARFLEKRGSMGFQAGKDSNAKRSEELIHKEVKRIFNPEFLNRIDEIILFEALSDSDLEEIVGLLIGMTNEVMKHKRLSIALQPEARKWIVAKTCLDRSYGARPLRRAIQKYIEDPLSEAIIQNQIKPDSALEIYVDSDNLHYFCVGESITSGVKLGQKE